VRGAELAWRILTWRATEVEYAELRDAPEGSIPVREVVRITKRGQPGGNLYPVAELVSGDEGFMAFPTGGVVNIDVIGSPRILGIVVYNTPFVLSVGDAGEALAALPRQAQVFQRTLLASLSVDMGEYWLAFNPHEHRIHKFYVPVMYRAARWREDWILYHLPEALDLLRGARVEEVRSVRPDGPETGGVIVPLGNGTGLVPEFEDPDALGVLEGLAAEANIRLPRVRTNQGWRVGLTGAHSLSLLLALRD